MAVRDMISTMSARLSSHTAITSNGITNGTIMDTAEYDLGVSFVMSAPIRTDGTYKLTFMEGDDSGLTDGTVVPADKIITLANTADDAVITGITAATTGPANLIKRAGVHSTKRYVRAVVNATAVTTGATISVTALLGAELIPA
jgi:hypothetical protein